LVWIEKKTQLIRPRTGVDLETHQNPIITLYLFYFKSFFFIKMIFFKKIKKYPSLDQIGFALALSTHGLWDLENKILVEVL